MPAVEVACANDMGVFIISPTVSLGATARPGDGTKDADPLPDASEAFYSALFQSELDKGVQMSNYEVDFLQDQTT